MGFGNGQIEASVRANAESRGLRLKCRPIEDGTVLCSDSKGDRSLSNWESFGFIFLRGKLLLMIYDFSRKEYDSVHQAIIRKYGTPWKEQMAQTKNDLGQTVVGTITAWDCTEARIVISEFNPNDLTESRVMLKDHALGRELPKSKTGGRID